MMDLRQSDYWRITDFITECAQSERDEIISSMQSDHVTSYDVHLSQVASWLFKITTQINNDIEMLIAIHNSYDDHEPLQSSHYALSKLAIKDHLESVMKSCDRDIDRLKDKFFKLGAVDRLQFNIEFQRNRTEYEACERLILRIEKTLTLNDTVH